MPRFFLSTAMLIAASLLTAPLWVIVAASLFAPGSVPDAGRWWPEDPSFDAHSRAWELAKLGSALGWSLLIAVPGMLLSVLVASLAALAIHLAGARSRRMIITVLVLAASVPATALWMPQFLLFREMGLHNTVVPLLAPALLGGSPLFVLLYLFSLRRIPIAQFEAAQVEGLGFWAAWWQVALPQMRGATLAVAFLSFAVFWGNVLDPLLYLRSGQITTAPLALHGLEVLGRGELSVWMAGAVWLLIPVAMLLAALSPWLKSEEN